MNLDWMPSLNAGLNAASLICLLAGKAWIRQGQETKHRNAMLTACVVSLVFLASYLYYHFNAGHTVFAHQGWIRPLYFTLLISHVLLAMTVPVFAVLLVRWGLQGKRDRHRKLAKVAWPLWVYVSASGLLVYGILYHWFPGSAA